LFSIEKFTIFAAKSNKVIVMNELGVLRNIPVNTAAVASLYPDVKSANRKVANLEKTGRIIRLKRGLYVVSPKESGLLLSLNLIGNVLYGPSYVSMLTALREYGLIPERVEVVESMTTHLTVSFQNDVGRFEYHHCAKDYYPIGITQREEEGVSYLIATPEKALCDYIITTPRLPLRFLKDTRVFLEEDLRLDMDAFMDMDADIFRQCAAVSKKQHAINNLIKILER
jgi:predicted transcriptional regulator of viral defense system